ncbi:MAG: AsmA-like C-terminal region-containing protein [Planctomycetota bacterium]
MTRPKTHKQKVKTIIHRLLAGSILIVLLWILFILAGRALCYIAIRQIGDLTNTRIRTASVDFHSDGSVFIRKLVISPSKEQNRREAIFRAEEVYARFSLSSLLLLQPRLKVIDVNDFVFDAQYDLDTGNWNLSAIKIKPPKGGSNRMPHIRLTAGTLQYTKISNGRAKVALSVPINAGFEFDEEKQDGYSFEITTATMASGFGQSRLTGFWKPGGITITGGISSVDIPDFEMAWMIDVLAAELKYDQSNNFSLKLGMKNLQSKRNPALDRLTPAGPAFREKSDPFAALRRFFDRYQPWGRVDIDLEAAGNFNDLAGSRLAGKVFCRDIAFSYHRFQYAIEELAGQIDFTQDSVTLNNLSGKHGDVRLFFNGWSSDFGPDWKYNIRITSDNMPLDEDLYNALSERQQEFWCSFFPTGFAAIDYRLTRNSQTDKQTALSVELRGADGIYQYFPYPLNNLTGKLSFDQNKVTLSDVVSQVNDRKITLNGDVVTRSDGNITYDISAKVNNLPLDSTLEASLPAKQRDLYKRFSPSGLASGWIKVSTQDAGPASFTADLSFEQASMKLEQFRLPFSDISAKAVLTPNLVIVREFSGRYGDSMVSLTGQIQPDQEGRQSRYRISAKLEDTRLSDDLFDLIPESKKETLAKLKPEGKVNLSVDLNKEDMAKPADCSMKIECLGNSITIPEFPYPLNNITGTLTVEDENIELRGVHAILDDGTAPTSKTPQMRLDGKIALSGNAFTSAALALSADNISFDERLALVLPRHVRASYERLSPTGRFALDFNDIQVRRAGDGRTSVDFVGDVNLPDAVLTMPGSEIELNAVLKTTGRYNTRDGLSLCQATVAGGKLRTLGKSFANLQAHVSYDPNSQTWAAENLVADCYGGKLRGKFALIQSNDRTGEYVLQTGFNNVDLQQFLSDTALETSPENKRARGKIEGSLNLSTKIGDSYSRIGTCRLTITEMQVGELPLLAKLLSVLRLTEAKDSAFEQMFVDSYIRHDRLVVKKLDLSGQDLAFSGSGWMDMKSRNVNLTLTARGRRLVTDDPSVLQSLTEGLGQAVVRVDITGNLYDPKITRRTLPVIEETLQILGTRPATSN